MMWVDSHCHPQMASDGAAVVLERARAAGVVGMVVIGTDLASSRMAVELAGVHDDVQAAVGLHPHDASSFDAEWPALVELAAAPGVVGIGETGFDFHYRHSSESEQARSFRAHLGLARDRDLALVVHTREAWDATFELLVDEGLPARTVLHCFTGGPAEAERALALGAYLSFSGIVSFTNAADVQAAAAACPLERMLVETDAPFLAPVPHRGSENEPARLPAVGAALAEACGRPVAEVASATASNAGTVFGTSWVA